MDFLHLQHMESIIHTLDTVDNKTYATYNLPYGARLLSYMNHACVYSVSNHFYVLICRKFQEDATWP
jgi:hypothetical protein